MRRFGICEERGTGIDKVVNEIERRHLPPPLFEVPPGSTRTVLFAHRDARNMDTAEKIRAVYQHACLRYVNRDFLTNASLARTIRHSGEQSGVGLETYPSRGGS